MASLSQTDKQEIYDDLMRVATWVTGPRVARVQAIAKRVLGEPEEEAPPGGQDVDERPPLDT